MIQKEGCHILIFENLKCIFDKNTVRFLVTPIGTTGRRLFGKLKPWPKALCYLKLIILLIYYHHLCRFTYVQFVFLFFINNTESQDPILTCQNTSVVTNINDNSVLFSWVTLSSFLFVVLCWKLVVDFHIRVLGVVFMTSAFLKALLCLLCSQVMTDSIFIL